ncbi:MAG: dienelactone hydrolase family protein [Limimaricola sp.]|uniref:dienelactone hydrolase family protein n=1 Tax=Limimaricola sp. TaxID=2211665 RepID=UPI001D3BED3A|nr:dienelactone hydrolase family protein [Limimaricola sp.]MBI1417018.1 dienelactone hydrolase family protein [Limimaricola sp.]
MPQRSLQITTPDGTAPATLFTPEGATPQSAIILYMDAFGPRPGLEAMAGRLAAMGHAVLLPDLFYRFGPYGPFDAATAFANPEVRAQLMGMIGKTTQAMTEADTGAFLDALTAAGVSGSVGTVGYCMGGARALTAAAAYPDRIVAAASIHGGHLAGDAPDSPHLRAGQIKGRVYVGCAGVDKSFPPEQSARLAQALRDAGVDHIIENYVGAEHGWAVPDHSVHNPAAAERHWLRLATFFGETL